MQQIRKRVTMVFQNGALFDSLSVRENVAFPLRERGGLEEEQVLQIVGRLLNWWGPTMWPRPAPRQPLHRQAARRRHRPGACRTARGRLVRRAHHHGGSHHCPPPGRHHSAPQAPAGYTSIVVTHDVRFAAAARGPCLVSAHGRGAILRSAQGFRRFAGP